jgi:RimJ/RimL family protein N-acetyltransferase
VTTTPERTWRTARLTARPACVDDAQVLFNSQTSDPVVARYLSWRPHREVGETIAFLRRCEAAWADGSAFPWCLWLSQTDELLGMIEVRVRPPKMDLGYGLARRWWKQGFMAEALRHVVAWGLAQPEIHRVWATCDVENGASARALERVGMQREGVLRKWEVKPSLGDEPRDCFCYSKVKEPK